MNKLKYFICVLCMTTLFTAIPVCTDAVLFSDTVSVEAASVKLSKKKVSLYVGKTAKLKLKGTSGDVIWASSNKKIAKVDSNGKITAVKAGKTTITAVYDGKAYSCNVTVKKPGLSDKELFLESGDTYSLEVKGTKAKSFKSSNKEVAKVNTKGKITAVNAGKCTISVTCANGKTYKCKITVNTLSPEALYEKCIKSVVEIQTETSQGSGFFIDSTTVVTNYHVIEGARSELKVIYSSGITADVDSILGFDPVLDVALLKVSTTGIPLELNSHGVTIGETTYTIGSSFGFTSTFSNGMVTMDKRVEDNITYIQTNAAISSGNSGGPLLNKYGEVMGITTFTIDPTVGVTQNLNFAIEISQIDKVDTSYPMTPEEFFALSLPYSYGYDPYTASVIVSDMIRQNGVYDPDTGCYDLIDTLEIGPGINFDFDMYFMEDQDFFIDFYCWNDYANGLLYPVDDKYEVYCLSMMPKNDNGECKYTVDIEFNASTFDGYNIDYYPLTYSDVPEGYEIEESEEELIDLGIDFVYMMVLWADNMLYDYNTGVTMYDLGFVSIQ